MGGRMSAGSVVFVNSIKCPSCGLLTSGYLHVHGNAKGTTTCPRCGASIIQEVPPGSVQQLPPPGFVESGQTHARRSMYAWLYAKPKEQPPRFCLGEVLRVAYSPTKALSRLYSCSDLKHALIIVVAFAVLSNVVSVIVTESMAEVIGYSATDALGFALQGVAGTIVTVISLLVFGIVASMASREVFGGRGDKGSTITLVSYCYPWFVLLTVALLAVFTAGFEGLNLDRVQHWTDAEMERAIVYGATLLAIAVAGIAWLLWVVSKAVGMANDVTTGSSALCAVLAAVAAGIVSLLVGVFVRLPIGINF